MQTSCPLCWLAVRTIDPGLQAAWGGSLDFCREDISTDVSKELLSQQSVCLKLSFSWPTHPSLPQLQVRSMAELVLPLPLPFWVSVTAP